LTLPLTPSPYSAQAARYALRGIDGTDLLAFRAVAERPFLAGPSALDLGCGAGRSSRFLRDLGFSVTGADISPDMLAQARSQDPSGDYRALASGQALPFPNASFDSVFSSWMLVEIGTPEAMNRLLREVRRVLRSGGRALFVTNTPEFYRGEWISCAVDFPENRIPLRSGQNVRVRLMPEGIELMDFFWSDSDYRTFFEQAGFRIVGALRPLGHHDDVIAWKSETELAPYVIYQLENTQLSGYASAPSPATQR